MKNYIIFDLEATCEKDIQIENETIEIGAVKVNELGEVIGEYSKFIKPIINPILTDFCKELTTITQKDVDTADSFKKVIKDFKEWIGSDYVLCSWGYYDKKQFKQDCILHNEDANWLEDDSEFRHISLKHQYPEIKGIKRAKGLQKTLRAEGFDFEGTAHRGIDDAKNTSKIFIKYLKDWKFK